MQRQKETSQNFWIELIEAFIKWSRANKMFQGKNTVFDINNSFFNIKINRVSYDWGINTTNKYQLDYLIEDSVSNYSKIGNSIIFCK